MSQTPSAVERTIAIAQAEVGVRESPANSNCVKYNTWYYGRSVSGEDYPWCMAFVQWVFAQSGRALPCKTASCSALLNWYQKNQPACVVKEPQPGDIVIYHFGHTGIVESVGKGTITAIEGNTSAGSSGSQSNGGGVFRRTRELQLVKAFLRPKVVTVDNTPSAAHREAVEWAVANGILSGNAGGDLMLSQPLTRQQFCTMLLRYHRMQ